MGNLSGMPWQPGLPQSEWDATLEPLAEAYLAELGIERDPEMHALTQIERLASIRRNHDIAVEWGKRAAP